MVLELVFSVTEVILYSSYTMSHDTVFGSAYN